MANTVPFLPMPRRLGLKELRQLVVYLCSDDGRKRSYVMPRGTMGLKRFILKRCNFAYHEHKNDISSKLVGFLWRLNKMAVYLHQPGLFHSPGFSSLLPKGLLVNEENHVMEMSLATVNLLPSSGVNCSEQLGDSSDGWGGCGSWDSCLLAKAVSAANQSAGCLSKVLRWGSKN